MFTTEFDRNFLDKLKYFYVCTNSMQKKLFIDPLVDETDQQECDVVYSQLINDVFDCRLPLSSDTAVSCFHKIILSEASSSFMALVN